MKKVTAYINTLRVHWVVEELQAAGVSEIMVTEYFKPTSQISRMQLCCEESAVEKVRQIVHRVGTIGGVPDHFLSTEEFDPKLPSLFPLGKRVSQLEESRIKQLINLMLRGVGKRLSLSFLLITISILCVGAFIHFRIGAFQESAREAAEKVRMVTNAANQIQTAHLEQLLATERLHRGDVAMSFHDFDSARGILVNAAQVLKESQLFSQAAIESLASMESRFQVMIGEMVEIVTRFSQAEKRHDPARLARLSRSHDKVMTSLGALHLECTDMLLSLEHHVRELASQNEKENIEAIQEVRGSLTLLAGIAILITVLIWLVTESKVARPLHVIVEEARTIDTGELK